MTTGVTSSNIMWTCPHFMISGPFTTAPTPGCGCVMTEIHPNPTTITVTLHPVERP